MLEKTDILRYFNNKGIEVEPEKIENLLNNINKEEIINNQRNRFRYEIWDKKTAINGVSASTIIKSRNYSINQAYIIYVDGKIIYFQDHNPNKEGYVKMTKTEAKKIAEDFIEKQIEENLNTIIINEITNSVSSK